MAIRNVFFRGKTAPEQQVNNTPQQSPQVVTNPIGNLKPDLISQEGANALRAYTLQNNPTFEGKKEENFVTSQEYIEQLKSKGLKEGKDFTVEKDGKFTEVHLNKNGQNVKDMVWFKEDAEEVFECYRRKYHSQNNPIESITTCIGGDGEFRYRAKTYEHKPVKNDELNANTTPEEYLEYLKQNNLKYTINYDWEDDDKYFQSFSVYNPKTDSMTKTIFARDLAKDDVLHLSKEYYDSNNDIEKSIQYYHDCTEITDFKEKPNYNLRT